MTYKDEGQSRQKCIGLQRFSVGLRGFGHKPWHDVLSQHGDEAGIYWLGENEKRRATQAVDPVIGGAPQTEPFARHVAAWQIGQAPVIDAHVAIGVEQTYALTVCAEHPLPSQAALPLGCLTVLTAEIRDFSP